MPVLRLARRIPPFAGGQEQHVIQLATEQSRQGINNIVAFADGVPGDLHNSCKWHKVPSVSWFPSDYGKGILFSIELVVSLKRRCSSVGANVVHSHGTAGDLWAILGIKSRETKVFHTFHASLVFPKHVRFAYSRLLPRLDGIFVVNELIREQLVGLDLELPPIYTLSSAVAPQLFRVKREPKPSSALMVGRLSKLKGFDVGILAAARLYKQGVISGVDIAGVGPEESKLRALAASKALPAVFHGHVDTATLGRLYARAAVLLCPSRTMPKQAEGTPTAVLEAWAASVPVVACASGGIPFSIHDGIDGMLAPEDDAIAISSRAMDAIRMSARLVSAGRRRVEGYTWSELARRVAAIYRNHGAQL